MVLLRLIFLINRAFGCVRLWLMARMAGVRISFGEIWQMRLRNTDVAEVVRVLCQAKQVDLLVSPAEIEQALLDGVDLKHVIWGMAVARRNGMDITFQESVHAVKEGNAEPSPEARP